ncbi:MAG: C25 family cysteine peptidase, partial [bacterium]
MRKMICVLLLLLICGFAAETVTFDANWASNPLFNVINQTPSGVELVFSSHQVVIEDQVLDGVVQKSFGVPAVFIAEPGVPNLGGVSRYVAVPQGARAQVVILDVRTEVYHNIEVAPASNIPPDNDNSPLRYEKDMAIYGRNAYWPSSPVKLSAPLKMRGVDVVLVGVMPFQYNPVTKELIVYKDIRFRVDFIGGNGHFGVDRLRSRFWEPILQGHLLNYGSLSEIDFYAPERIDEQSGFEYIIIVPDDALFEAWADTIKAWRKLQGISCDVFTLTEIGGSTWQAIENFLNNAYNTWNPAPVAFLILSDYPSSGDVYGVTAPTWNSYCVADNIYADVNGDNLPDMHHGRITAQTATHLDRMVNKFLSYERSPYTDAGFYDHPLVACGWQTERWFQLCSETVREFMINEFGKTPARQYNIYSGTPIVGGPWSTRVGTAPVVQYWYNLGWLPALTNQYNAAWWDSGSSTGITNAINSGCFIVQHRDHGYTGGWGEPPYNMTHLNSLTNTMYPYVYSINCQTGEYDYPSEVFAEKFHRIQYGALGIMAADENSYSFVNDTYIWGTYNGLWSQFDPGYPLFDMEGHDNLRPSPAMSSAKYYLVASWMPDSAQAGSYRATLINQFHHHGDCFFTLYSEIPQNLTVSHAATLPGAQLFFTVTADDSSIIALTVDGEIIGVDEGTGSAIDITISPQAEGDTMLVTVTKANYYRYTALVPVTGGGATMPNVILVDYAVVGGNGNGILDPGEDAGIVCTIANVGSDVATNTTGTLRCANSYITLTDSTTNYGTLQIQDTV